MGNRESSEIIGFFLQEMFSGLERGRERKKQDLGWVLFNCDKVNIDLMGDMEKENVTERERAKERDKEIKIERERHISTFSEIVSSMA